MNWGFGLRRKWALYALFFASSVHTVENAQDPKTVWMTVFVHGIMSIKHHLSISNVIRWLTDDVRHSIYAYTVEYMRQDPFFTMNQPMQDVGLYPIDMSVRTRGAASAAFARIYDEVDLYAHPNRTYENKYYTFGWSGLLSATIRYEESVGFYRSLTAEVERLRAEGYDPKVRIVGYSHGGNIALNLAAVRLCEAVDPSLVVDELILIAVPIQSDTDFFLNEPTFKRVYHMYSHEDRVQKLDFFSCDKFFSRRMLKCRSCFELSPKLTQVHLKVMRLARPGKLRKTCWIRQNPLCYAKLNNKAFITGRARKLRDMSPGHIEIWSFGWSPASYRKDFSLHPLPLAIFTPLITHEVAEYKAKFPCHPNDAITCDIRPDYAKMIIKQHKRPCKDAVVANFFTLGELNTLKDDAIAIQPETYTQKLYSEHIIAARDVARGLYCSYVRHLCDDCKQLLELRRQTRQEIIPAKCNITIQWRVNRCIPSCWRDYLSEYFQGCCNEHLAQCPSNHTYYQYKINGKPIMPMLTDMQQPSVTQTIVHE